MIAVKDPAHVRRDVGADAPMLVKNAVPVPKDITDDKVGGGCWWLVYARWSVAGGDVLYGAVDLAHVISYHPHTHTRKKKHHQHAHRLPTQPELQ